MGKGIGLRQRLSAARARVSACQGGGHHWLHGMAWLALVGQPMCGGYSLVGLVCVSRFRGLV